MAENPWLDRRVVAYAHQGGAWEAPSSTLFAIRRALAAGATAIELDVHSTRDGQLVVCHDATVDRTTDGHGAIADLTFDQVRRLDNAYWFVPGADVTLDAEPDAYLYRGRAPEDREFGVATLAEVLEAFPGVVLNLDVKQTAPTVAPYEEALGRVLAHYGRTDDVIVASFLDLATERFRSVSAGVGTSAGTIGTAMWWKALHDGAALPPLPVVAFQVPEQHGELTVVDAAFVGAAHGAGVAVHVWTVNDEPSVHRLVDLGVDGIISDLPTMLVRVLAERGVAWDPSGAAPA